MGNILLIIFFATLAMGSRSSESHTILQRGHEQFSSFPQGKLRNASQICNNGLLGECSQEEEMAMESSINGRNLARKERYISYDALKKNNAPCKRRGNSYYGCGNRGKDNPYRRGCSVVTHCSRSTD
ncbi:RALF 4 [Spatholobus suberectus]|nr:RALF 4 [Spatholobus suberectus]